MYVSIILMYILITETWLNSILLIVNSVYLWIHHQTIARLKLLWRSVYFRSTRIHKVLFIGDVNFVCIIFSLRLDFVMFVFVV